MRDPIREVAEAIVRLGITDAPTLAPFVHAQRERILTGSTQSDGDDEAARFLLELEQARVLGREQIRQVLRAVEGRAPAGAAKAGIDDPFVGRVFGGYRLREKLGEGGMGAVYRAERVADGDRHFVVKLLSPLSADAATYVRFQREGEVMMAVAHPNVVRVFHAGQEEGLCYLVMELVDGPSLHELCERKGRFDWRPATKAARQIALGLEAAHAIGIIHRDVKPQNVILERAHGMLKVADFGLAKSLGKSEKNISHAGDILGSPAYIAPEQWGDHDVDARADLFALGVVYYQLLTGVLPFRGRTPADYARSILDGRFEPVRNYAPDVPEGASQVVTRLLERRREERYRSATALIADLERVLRGEPPDMPRLEKLDGSGERFVLIGREQWDVGRRAPCHLVLDRDDVAERHARLERNAGTLLLRDLGAPGGTRVNGQKISSIRPEITLKDRDVVEFASAPPLRYCAGRGPDFDAALSAVASQLQTSGEGLLVPGVPADAEPPEAPLVVSAPVFEALVRAQHPRAILAMVEMLDETTWTRRVDRGKQRLLDLRLPADTAERARERGLASLKRKAVLLAEHLFQATCENLGSDPDTWLGWWLGGARARFPRQVRLPGSRARAVLATSVSTESGTNVVPLNDGEQWVIGRAHEAEIQFTDRSVSRRHAVIYRLLTRYAIRDEGSRFGTVIRGVRRGTALLRHDDVIELGRVQLRFRQPSDAEEATRSASGLREVDASVFEGLAEIRSPHAVEGLVGFLDETLPRREASAARAELPDVEGLETMIAGSLGEWRRLACEALPSISGKNYGLDLAAWRAWWKDFSAAFPVQVLPEGFGAG